MAEAYIVDAIRSPTGRRKGGLAHVHGADLGAHVLKAIVERNGIPDDVLSRIFEPFFTTKSSGTGLGLAIARDLAESLGGSVDLAPADPGLVVRITLPLSAI